MVPRARQNASLGIAALLLAIFWFQSYSSSRLKSPTFDEPVHIAAGLSYVQTGLIRLNLQHPPLLKEMAGLSMVLAGIRWPQTEQAAQMLAGTGEPEWSFGDRLILANGPERVLFWSRLPLIVVAGLGGVFLFLLGREIVGVWAALGALFLYALDPTIVAHSYLVTTDVGLTASMLFFLWVFWKYLQAPNVWRLLATGAAMGVMLCTKFSAVFVVPVAGLLLLAALRWPLETSGQSDAGWLNPFGAREEHYGRKVTALACSFGLMCLAAFAVIEAVYLSPRGIALYGLGIHRINEDHNPNYLVYMGGQLGHNFRSYLAVCYLLKEPLAGVVLAALGVYELFRTKGVQPLSRLFLVLPPIVLFTAYTIWSDNVGIRYLIPVLPFVYLISGMGLTMLLRGPSVFSRGVAVFLGIWIVAAAAGIYPDHLSYFNEAACLARGKAGEIGFDGGTACGPLWLDDSNVDWGQGFKQLRAWMERNDKGRTFQLGFFGTFPPAAYGLAYKDLDIPEVMQGPHPGLYVLSAHLVARLPALGERTHPGDGEWLRQMQPTAVVGHSLYVYDLPPQSAGNSTSGSALSSTAPVNGTRQTAGAVGSPGAH